MRSILGLATLSLAAGLTGPAAADIKLRSPVDCSLGKDCYIQQYVDHTDGGGASDYLCGSLSYNDHSGTDFALPTIADMQRGVRVLAAADGVVARTRDGMSDRVFKTGDAIGNRDCGNGVVINHTNGWTTQYCHLKKGSVRVRKGAKVSAGTVLGQIGLSGRTQFPHVHMTVRKHGKVVDPFDPDGKITCGAPSSETLWTNVPTYQAGGLLNAGFSDRVPEFADIKAGEAARASLPPTAPAVVVFGYAFGTRTGDKMRLTIKGPQGTVIDQAIELPRNQAQVFRAIGKKRTTQSWPAGTYRGIVTLVREGRVVNTKTSEVRIQ